jgi:Protein of unknown function (DUF2934)
MTDVKDCDEVPGMLSEPGEDEERVRKRAYEIWEEEGRPEGRDLDHWNRAKQEVRKTDDDLTRAEGEISSLSESD